MTTFTNTSWQMIRSDKYVEITHKPHPIDHGDPSNYQYAQIPLANDPRWANSLAPTDADGNLNFDEPSKLPGGWPGGRLKNLDFTYFRSFVNIPEGTTITQFRVTIAQVDDGARMYLFNNRNVGGKFIAADDGKLNGVEVSADFTDVVIPGQNMICIVQFDDSPVRNRLTGGVQILLNNQVVQTNPDLPIPDVDFAPKKFYMETYGIHGQGQGGTKHWIGWNAGPSTGNPAPGIITDTQDADSTIDSYKFEIEQEDVEGGVALKVTNYQGAESGKSYYLPDLVGSITPPSNAIYKQTSPLWPRNPSKEAEYNFVSYESTSKPGNYLRHSHFILSNATVPSSIDSRNPVIDFASTTSIENIEKVYRQDCSWRFHEVASS